MKRKIHFIAAMVLILVCSSTVPAMERSISDRNSLHALNPEAVPQTGYEGNSLPAGIMLGTVVMCVVAMIFAKKNGYGAIFYYRYLFVLLWRVAQ